MSKISDAISEGARELFGFTALGAAGFAINAGAALTFKTANTIAYLCDGVFKSRTALAAQAFVAGTTKPYPFNAGGMTCLFLAGLNAAGAMFLYQSSRAFMAEVQDDLTTKYRGYDLSLDAAGNPVATKAPQLEDFNSAFLPDVPAGITPIGIFKWVATSANVVPGVSALDLAGTTVGSVYYDISLIPGATNL